MLCTISITVAVHRRCPPSPSLSSLIFYVSCVHVYSHARALVLSFLFCVGCCTDIYIKDILYICTWWWWWWWYFIRFTFHWNFIRFIFIGFEQDRRKCCSASGSFVDRSVSYSYFHPNLMPFCVIVIDGWMNRCIRCRLIFVYKTEPTTMLSIRAYFCLIYKASISNVFHLNGIWNALEIIIIFFFFFWFAFSHTILLCAWLCVYSLFFQLNQIAFVRSIALYFSLF